MSISHSLPACSAVALVALLASSCSAAERGHEAGGASGEAGSTSSPPAAPSAGAAAGGPEVSAAPDTSGDPGLGFSLRDSRPYARFGATAVLDTEHDRMILYGGSGGNDLWQLSLSGPHAERWEPLHVRGDHPPAHAVNTFVGPSDSAVYDPVRHSMIVCVTTTPTVTEDATTTRIWELSLHDEPVWTLLATPPPESALELQGARIALDAARHRVLLFGGAQSDVGLWSLSLDGDPTFTRLADGPEPDDTGTFYGTHSLMLDARRDRLVLVGALPRQKNAWAFDVSAGTWSKIGDWSFAVESYGASALFDDERDQLVVIGGDEQLGVFSTFDPEAEQWSSHPSAQSDAWYAPSAVLDAARDRVIVFGGMTGAPIAETWTLALDTLAWSQLGSPSVSYVVGDAGRTSLYDPVRDAVVSFGSHEAPATYVHALDEPSDGWTALAAGVTPRVSSSAAIYDPLGEAIVAFSGYAYSEVPKAWRLPSDEGATWQELVLPGGPLERSRHAMVYDALNQRAIVFAGTYSISYPPSTELSDVWALSLGAAPAWSELVATGVGPTGSGYGGIYDPEGQRVIAFGAGITYALTLAPEPRWERLETRGPSPEPGELPALAALYDPDERRMIVVTQNAHDGVHVFALPLDASLDWHAFCPDTITPSGATTAVLVPDGLFLSAGAATWRFDLATPYCD